MGSASFSQAQGTLTQEEFDAARTQLGSDNPEERIAGIEALGRRGWRMRRQISPLLRNMLRSDPDWRVRASSGRAIGRLSVRDAVPDLVRALRDAQVEVRVVAAAALWRLPDPAAVPGLLELLNDRDPAARQWAALALGVIRDNRATAPLIRLVNDSAPAVRLDTIRSLGRIGDATALEVLVAAVNEAERPMDERLEAINSVASLDSPDKVNALNRMLTNDERQVRLRAVRALGQVGDALVVPTLRRRSQAERRDDEMRGAIAEAIEAINQRARERAQAGAGGGGGDSSPSTLSALPF